MSNIITPEFRISFPKLFTPETNKLSGKTEYSCVALFPPDADLTALKQAAQEAAQTKWPQGAPPNMRNPFRDQAEKVQKHKETKQPIIGEDGQPLLQPGCVRGAIFLNLKSQQKPGIVDANVQDIIDQSEIYSGCWCKASVRAYGYDQAGNAGVAFGLANIQKIRDDDPLGGTRSKPQDDFAPIAGGGEGAPAPADAAGLFD